MKKSLSKNKASEFLRIGASKTYWAAYRHYASVQMREWRVLGEQAEDLSAGKLVALLLAHGRLSANEAVDFESISDPAERISRSAALLRAQPITDRRQLAAWFDERANQGRNRTDWITNSTGGSTGTPLQFFTTASSMMSKRYRVYGARRRLGWRPGDLTLMLWGSDEDFGARSSRVSSATQALSRFQRVGTFRLDSKIIGDAATVIKSQARPVAVFGYASLVGHFFRHPKVQALPPECFRTVWTAAESLPVGTSEDIANVLSIHPGEIYGSREFGALATRLVGESEFEVESPFVLIEIVDDNGRRVARGERGRILVTDLTNLATPFIRYEIGDIGIAGSWGALSLKRLSALIGRSAELLNLEGISLSPIMIHHAIRDLDSGGQFSAHIWPSKGQFLIATTENLSEQDAHLLKARLQRLLPPHFEIAFARVSSVERTASGKYRILSIHE